MIDNNKTNEQLINELAEIRKQKKELELLLEQKQAEESLLLLSSVRDITRQKKILTALNNSGACFLTIFDKLSIGIAMIDIGGRPFECNSCLQNMLGYSSEELNRLVFANYTHPDDIEKSITYFKELMSGKRTNYNMEKRYIRKDGRQIWVLISVFVAQDTARKPLFAVALVEDVTERKNRDEQLRKLSRAVEYGPAKVIICNIDGNIEYVNNKYTNMTGYTIDDVIGKSLNLLEPNKTPLENYDQLLDTVISGNEWRGILHYINNNQEDSWESVSISPIKDSDGATTHFVTIQEDITTFKKAEKAMLQAKEAAEAANKAKSEFLASMSHEIRTPMNSIIGMTDLLWETKLTKEQKGYVEICKTAGENLLNIINDVLDFSKIEIGHVSLEHIDFDINLIVDRVCDIMAIRAHEKKLELTCHLMPDVPTYLVGDPVRLKQILFNLIGNAIKFTEKGEVVLKIDLMKLVASDPLQPNTIKCNLLFSVSDTGIGILPEKLDDIFNMFTQADSSTTRKYGGTGLGLTISKKLVELMGGNIWVESIVEVGSTFFFTSTFEVQSSPKRLSTAPSVDIHGVKSLVIDDNSTNRMILRETLTAWGAIVVEAEDGSQGLAELRRAKEAGEAYKLVLLDCRMPIMDGFTVAKHIKNDPSLVDMTVMMLTSDIRMGDTERYQKYGISVYMVKPIKRLELSEAINTAMNKMKVDEKKLSSEAALVLPENKNKLRILLVEDYPENCLLIRSYLKNTPYEIDEAENGEVAVDKYKHGKYDILLMDMQMPVMDGYTATRAIRNFESQHKVRETPIIALTAYAFKEDVQKSLEAGCNAHLTKPVKKIDLIKLINKYTEVNYRNQNKITVYINPELKELIPGFLENRRIEIKSILDSLIRNDFEAIRITGHNMQGIGGGYGFHGITDIGVSLEQAAKDRKPDDIKGLVEQMINYLECIEVVYE